MKKLTKSQQKTWDILSTDTQSVDFKQFRKNNDYLWLTKERELMLINDMDTNHIVAAINMLERCDQSNTRAYQGLCKELNRRYMENGWSGYED